MGKLEDIYYLLESDDDYPTGDDKTKASEKEDAAYEKLYATFSDEQRKLFNEFTDALIESMSISEHQTLARAMALGMQIQKEVCSIWREGK